jgi:transcription initiation factor IIE alpha subunit
MRYMAYFCRGCGWRSEAFKAAWAMKPRCPECDACLNFVRFDEGEREAAEKIVRGKLELINEEGDAA